MKKSDLSPQFLESLKPRLGLGETHKVAQDLARHYHRETGGLASYAECYMLIEELEIGLCTVTLEYDGEPVAIWPKTRGCREYTELLEELPVEELARIYLSD